MTSTIRGVVYAILAMGAVAGPFLAIYELGEGKRPRRGAMWLVIALAAVVAFAWLWRSNP